jgi:hypothetical protein
MIGQAPVTYCYASYVVRLRYAFLYQPKTTLASTDATVIWFSDFPLVRDRHAFA